MSLADELSRLDELHARGALSAEEFARAKARLLEPEAPTHGAPAVPPGGAAINRLRRSRSQRWLGGVCGGVAAASGVDAWVWRLVVVALALFGGTGVLLYLLLWIFVPSE
jgi:phage shock protein PspC (stress-responsive transcriptional regulator)